MLFIFTHIKYVLRLCSCLPSFKSSCWCIHYHWSTNYQSTANFLAPLISEPCQIIRYASPTQVTVSKSNGTRTVSPSSQGAEMPARKVILGSQPWVRICWSSIVLAAGGKFDLPIARWSPDEVKIGRLTFPKRHIPGVGDFRGGIQLARLKLLDHQLPENWLWSCTYLE